MFEYFSILSRARELAPHGYCLLWQPELVWTHVIADALIAAAYFSIPIAIVRFVTGRKDVAFSWIFWLFALFIVACGTTHLMSIWTLWNPDYGWEALIKVVTAIASVGTAIVLWPLIPKALAIPSPLQLKEANAELGARVRERDEALAQLRREIAERERAEAALVQAQKMEAVGQLTGGIAHDFNNLLQAVAGSLELIARGPGDPARVKRLAERGLQAAERGTRLTGQLLAFSRVQRLDLRPVAVTPLVEGMLDLLSRSLGSGIAIRTELDDGGAAVLADKTQLELALLNLAINGRDAMADGGVLTIATRARPARDGFQDGTVEVEVRDTGCGMPPEVIERAFEPFFTTKGVGKGTGLGLSMVYGVARQSGGEVRIDSREGEGTTVTIELRRVAAPAADPAPEARAEGPLPEGNGQTVLVVDDDEDVRATIRNSLEALGYRVRDASGGPQALAILAVEAPALSIFDYAMPEMSGADLAREAAVLRPGMPVIFASGYAETGVLERTLGGETPILRKPFAVGELADLVAEMLKRAGQPRAV
ncbi:MAG: ATP-binding protein [Allosphingosinicella sp.]|uniref:ATP-binding protein n=1 Tax=Allosphingosinicella sp. TaxID=2823234 RepID=UPI00395DC2D1